SQDSHETRWYLDASDINISASFLPPPENAYYLSYKDTGSVTLDTGIGDGNDSVFVSGISSSATINIGAGTSTVDVYTTGLASTLNIVGNVGQGNDAINLGVLGSVQGIMGTVNIENPQSLNDINVNDSVDMSAPIVVLSTLGTNSDDSEGPGDIWGQIGFAGLPGLVNYEYNDTNSLTVETSAGSSVLVSDTNSGYLACQTNIVSSGPTTVDVGGGGVDVQGIASTLNLENPNSVDTITVDDSVDGQARTATLSTLGTAGQISSLTPGNINYDYDHVDTLTIAGSGGGTTFDVTDVPPAKVSVILDGTGGTNTLNGPNQANSWTLTNANDGILDSNITFHNFQDLGGGNVGDTFTLSSNIPIATSLLLNSASTLTTSSGTQFLAGAIDTNNGNLLTVAGAGNTAIQGTISGTGGLSMQATGTLTLSAANSYSGGTTIVSSSLIVTHDAALGAAGHSTMVDAGATLAFSGSVNYATAEGLFLNGTGAGGAGALESKNGGNTFAGNITLQSPSTINCATQLMTLTGLFNNNGFLLTFDGSGDTTIAGMQPANINGSGGLSKQGSGTLTLADANNYTGNTVINAGVLVVSHAGALGFSNSTTVAAGATLALSGGFAYGNSEQLNLNGQGVGNSGALLSSSGANSFAGPITLQSGSKINSGTNASLTLTGAINNGGFLLTVASAPKGSSIIKGVISGAGALSGQGIVTLSASNSYSGNTTIVMGSITVTQDAALGAANSKTTVDAGATLAFSRGFTYSTPEILFLNGTGFGGAGALENMSDDNSFAGPIQLQAASTINAAADNLTLSGLIDNAGDPLTLIGAGNIMVPGSIIGGSVNMQGTGALTLSTSNGFNAIDISSGTVNVEANGALGGTATVFAGGTLVFAGVNYTLPAALMLNGGNVVSLNLLSATDTFAGSVQQMAPSNIGAAPGTTFTFSGPMAIGGGLLTVAGGGTLFFNGLISGTGGLNQLPCMLTLSANNTYTGPNMVGGTLIVNGIQPASMVLVLSAGTLAGTGSVGAVLVASGGTVEPGPLSGGGNGTLTAASADFSQGGTLLIRIPAKGTPGVNYGQFNVTGTLTLGGTSTLQIDVSGLSKRGKFSGIVLYASVSGTFSNVPPPINNPLGLTAKPKYRSTSLDVDLT
ncbi:MAG TPA: autotransporter-associated beta strand repeat-containing protein, partial [Gemmataceae bacterium]|nr:autotransporter-associated beta strand repeat-containing protein [Gemmataceae bacterium]